MSETYQPDCLSEEGEPCGTEQPVPDPKQAAPLDSYHYAVIGWLVVAAVVIIVDIWISKVMRQRNLSQGTQHWSRLWKWFRIGAWAAWVVLGWHLFVGGPI